MRKVLIIIMSVLFVSFIVSCATPETIRQSADLVVTGLTEAKKSDTVAIAKKHIDAAQDNAKALSTYLGEPKVRLAYSVDLSVLHAVEANEVAQQEAFKREVMEQLTNKLDDFTEKQVGIRALGTERKRRKHRGIIDVDTYATWWKEDGKT